MAVYSTFSEIESAYTQPLVRGPPLKPYSVNCVKIFRAHFHVKGCRPINTISVNLRIKLARYYLNIRFFDKK